MNREDKGALRRQRHIENKKSGYVGARFSVTLCVTIIYLCLLKEIIPFRFTITPNPSSSPAGGDPGSMTRRVRVGAKGPLGAPSGFGRVGRDHLHAQLLQGTPELRRVALVHLAAGRRRVPVMAVGRYTASKTSPRPQSSRVPLGNCSGCLPGHRRTWSNAGCWHHPW